MSPGLVRETMDRRRSIGSSVGELLLFIANLYAPKPTTALYKTVIHTWQFIVQQRSAKLVLFKSFCTVIAVGFLRKGRSRHVDSVFHLYCEGNVVNQSFKRSICRSNFTQPVSLPLENLHLVRHHPSIECLRSATVEDRHLHCRTI